MESICNKNYLLALSLWTLMFLNSAQAYCVKKNSQSTVARAAFAPSSGSYSPSSSPLPTQSTPPSSSPAPKSTPSSSSPSPTQSTSPSSSPSAPKSTPSSSSPSPTQSASPSSGPSAPKSTPSSSSPSTTQSTPSSNPSPQDSTPSSPTPTPKSPSPSSNPSSQMQSTQTSAPPPSQNPPPPTTQTQAPQMTPPTMMDSPDGEVPTTSSPTGSPSRGVFGFRTSSTVVKNEAIEKICQHTDHPRLCLESISPFFNGKTDVMQVLAMAINASYAQTELGMKLLDELASKPATSPELASALQDCKENFGDALDNLEAARDAIEDDDIGTIQTNLSAALTDYVTCTDGFPGLNPIGTHSDKLNNMASNCLAIAELHK